MYLFRGLLDGRDCDCKRKRAEKRSSPYFFSFRAWLNDFMFLAEDRFQTSWTPSLWSHWMACKHTSPWTWAKLLHLRAVPPSPLGHLPTCLRFDMWCSRSALRRLQQIAVTPLNITGAVTGDVQRKMSTMSRVYVTRQIPPEGLKILRESGQWVTVFYHYTNKKQLH